MSVFELEVCRGDLATCQTFFVAGPGRRLLLGAFF